MSKTVKTFLQVILIMATVIRIPILPIGKSTKLLLGYPKDSLLNFTELTAEYGYASEEHTVVTEDGYVLTMFRIVGARKCREARKGPPVVLMHGLLQSSDCWIDAGPNSGLAYLLADACYDLWLGNTRGNYYSRQHITLDSDTDSEYWQFSADEIGFYDLPAFISYVLNKTGSEKVNYIGFSQGGGTFFIMCSERPEFCDKTGLAIAISPAARLKYTKSMVLRMLSTALLKTENILHKAGIHEVFAKGAFTQELIAFICQMRKISERLCASFIDVIDSVNPTTLESISNATTRTLFGHFPAGTSVHNFARYGQLIKSKKFEKFDYGSEKNLQLYGTVNPPEYNLSATKVPVVVIYGRNDGLIDARDIKWLVGKLPLVLESVAVKDPLWTHLDVMYSQYTREMIFSKINKYLLKYSHT